MCFGILDTWTNRQMDGDINLVLASLTMFPQIKMVQLNPQAVPEKLD
jgi:hypothetical protein